MLRASREEVEKYLSQMKNRGAQTLSTLGKLKPFADCMDSEMGFTLLNESIDRYEELLDKVAELTASDVEKVEFKAIKQFLINFSTRIAAYNQRVKEIKQTGK